MKKLLIPLLALMLATVAGCRGNEESIIVEKSIKNDARIGYEINIASFANGNKKNDTDSIKGDIDGIIDKLDYLKDSLNVEIIHLEDIFTEANNLGYDVADFTTIKSEYGGMKAYKRLLREAHKRNMYVTIDLSINTTSTLHPWFKKAEDGVLDYKDYYRWSTDNTLEDRYEANGKYYYSSMGENVADLNFDNVNVYNEILKICKQHIDLGIDGFRINDADLIYAPNELDEADKSLESLSYKKNLSFFNRLSHDLRVYDSNIYLSLSTNNSAGYNAMLLNEGIDSIIDLESRNDLIRGIAKASGQELMDSISDSFDKYFNSNQSSIISLSVSGKKTERLINSFNLDKDKARASMALGLLLPGISWIYNGDELGLSAKANEDVAYKWGDKSNSLGADYSYSSYNEKLPSALEALKDDDSLLSLYSTLTGLKANNLVIRNGSFKAVKLNPAVASFTRSYRGKTYLIAINTSNLNKSIYYKLNEATEIFNNGNTIKGNEVKLIPYGIAIIETESVKAPDLEKIILHYKGNSDYMLYEWSCGIPRWIKLKEDNNDEGYRYAEINIKGLNLIDFEFLVGLKIDGRIESSGKKKVKLTDDGDKICHIYLDEDINLVSYEIAIDSSFPFKKGQIIKIYAWRTTEDGKFYSASIEHNKLIFKLDKAIDNINIVIFDKSSPIDWSHTIALTNDIRVWNGDILTEISWK